MGSCPQIVSSPKMTVDVPSSVEKASSVGSNSQLIQVQSPTVISNAKTMLDAVFEQERCNGYTFYNSDFTKFDPRLSLDIDLNLFQDENEKLVLLLKVKLCLILA